MGELDRASLMWVVVGHDDQDILKDGKCSGCGADYKEWRERIAQQGAATQADCCKGIVLNKSAESP